MGTTRRRVKSQIQSVTPTAKTRIM
jgi:hypothetical protein